MRKLPFAVLSAGLVALSCTDPPPLPNGIACETPTDPDVLWGYADLHVHPAAELAFRERLVWGHLESDAPLSSNVLPPPDPCPVDSHARVSDPLQRTAHSLILGLMNSQDGFAHGPIAIPETSHAPPASAWPDARDVTHQQMHINALRRAFEGGLRVALVAATDNQALAQLLEGPRFPGPISPDQGEELESATRQLTFIVEMARRHNDWMAVAESPAHAREIVRDGRLALILSLEMDALRVEDVENLVARFPIAHIFPIHLIDNHVGGAAASGDIFNGGGAFLSPLFDPPELDELRGCATAPLAYQCVDRDGAPRTRLRLGRPLVLAPPDVPLIYLPASLPFPLYERLDYDDLDFCGSGEGARPGGADCFARPLDGHRNRRAVYPAGLDAIRRYMDLGLVIDLSHMGYASAAATVALAEERGYPLIASHSSVSESAEWMVDERDLNLAHAQAVARLGGMLGLGTGRRHDEQLLMRWVDGPALCTTASAECPSAACLSDSLDGECAGATPRPMAGVADETASVTVRGARSVSADQDALLHTIVELELFDGCEQPSIRVQQELDCRGALCEAVAIPLPPLASAGGTCGEREATPSERIRRVTVRWFRLDDCASGQLADSTFEITSAEVRVGDTVVYELVDTGAPIATLSAGRDAVDLIREDLTCASPVAFEDRSLLRLTLENPGGATDLPSASIGRYGSDLCVRVRTRASDGTCARAPAESEDGGCPPGWLHVNHRGPFRSGTNLSVYTRVPDARSIDDVCGVELLLASADEATSRVDLGEVRIESIGDPVRRWMHEYATQMSLFGVGRIAFGTDFNGGPPQMPISRLGPTRIELTANGCRTVPLVPMRSGDREIRIDERGLATIGQVPDLLAAVQMQDDVMIGMDAVSGQAVIDSVFRSAGTFIDIWQASIDRGAP
ncbi:MAG: hypothetical protein AB7P00_19805 [Sandaracinaceae bacterium]